MHFIYKLNEEYDTYKLYNENLKSMYIYLHYKIVLYLNIYKFT